MTVMSDSSPLVRNASTWETVLRSTPRSAGMPPSGASGRVERRPSACTTSMRSTVPYWKRVTTRVHSPTSVAAIRRPIRALTNVDLPALIRPATASCSGPSSRASTPRMPAAVGGETCGRRAWLIRATAADSGPCIGDDSFRGTPRHRVGMIVPSRGAFALPDGAGQG